MKTAMRWLGFVLVFGMLFGTSGCWWHDAHHDNGHHYGERGRDGHWHDDGGRDNADQRDAGHRDNGRHLGQEKQRDYSDRR